MLAIGGVRHLTGGGKKEGNVTCETMLQLCNREPVELAIDGGSRVVVAAGQPPVVDGEAEVRMRVGCGSATIGMFAPAVGTAGSTRWWWWTTTSPACSPSTRPASSSACSRPASTCAAGARRPGRYFRVAEPGAGWGGTDITDPLAILGPFNPKQARPGLTHADGQHHRRGRRLLRARRGAAAGAGGDAGRSRRRRWR